MINTYNKIKKNSIVVILLFFSFSLAAQNPSKVWLNLSMAPQKKLEGVSTIYIEPFKNDGSNKYNPDVINYMLIKMTELLSKNNFNASGPVCSQYAHTDWFVIVYDKNEADAVISGTYNVQAEEIRNIIEEQSVDTILNQWIPYYHKKLPGAHNTKDPGYHTYVPITTRTYEYKNKVSLQVNFKLTDKNGKLLYEFPYTNSKEVALPKTSGTLPTFKKNQNCISLELELVDDFVLKALNDIVPRTAYKHFALKPVDISDKDLKKKIKYKNLGSQWDAIYETGIAYTEIYKAEKNPNAAYNAAVLFYVLGFYADAEEWLQTSGIKDEIIPAWIKYHRERRQKAGHPLREKRVIYN